MDDDIDIEEHDVLDNPIIRSIFPDIASVKKEITQYFEEPNIKEEIKFEETKLADDIYLQTVVSGDNFVNNDAVHTLPVTNLRNTHNKLSWPVHTNKIVLGSKPTSSAQDDCGTIILGSIPRENTQANKVILGSKPNIVRENDTKLDILTNCKAQVKVKHMKLLLQDIKSYLNSNDKYCKPCGRLFRSKDAIAVHANKDHKVINSDKELVIECGTVSRYICSICNYIFANNGNLSRHYKNIHKKNLKFKTKQIKTTSSDTDTQRTNHIDDTLIIQNLKKQINTKEMVLKAKNNSNGSTYSKTVHKKVLRKDDVDDDDVPPYKKSKCSAFVKEYPNAVINNKISKTDVSNAYLTKHNVGTAKENISIATAQRNLKSISKFKANKGTCLKKNENVPIPLEEKQKNSQQEHLTKKENLKDFAKIKSNIKPITSGRAKNVGDNEKYELVSSYAFRSSNVSHSSNKFPCHHCDIIFPDEKSVIDHMYEILATKTNNSSVCSNNEKNCNINFFVFESVVFACLKCNICFLSSKAAREHQQHIEMLIWKCSICRYMFKEQDKDLHLIQHTFSKPIQVIQLDEVALNNVLYNCTKCSIHFMEQQYQEHYPKCGNATTDSMYCKICDILLDKMNRIHHNTQHELLKGDSDFTVISSNIIVNTAKKATKHFVKPRNKYKEQRNCLTYCYTCNSFLNGLGIKHPSHIKGTCSSSLKYVCDECGLVFGSSSLAKHKLRHMEPNKMTLQDYIFFDPQGKQVLPPIPKYPHCDICGIHFLTKYSVAKHICDETDFNTCDICNIKYAQTAYKLHLAFHNYFIENSSSSINNNKGNLNHATDIVNLQTLKPDKNPATVKIENQKSRKSSPLTKTETKVKRNIKPRTVKKDKIIVQESRIESIKEKKMDQVLNDDPVVVLYTCKTCGVSVESYDEVVEHSQIHYNAKEDLITSIEKCTKCSLNYGSLNFIGHQKRVHSDDSKIEILKFDPNYLTSKLTIWVKHIFHSIPDKLSTKIIQKSIYQHEQRIKLKVIQKGTSEIRVYKCDLCNYFIDSCDVYKHVESPCGNGKHFPCNFCSLPFISMVSKKKHEIVHKQIKGLNKKSFNIILFNQNQDKEFTNRILGTLNQYILYQCRNCYEIEENLMLSDHSCGQNSLTKCVTCGLLFNKDVITLHLSKHTDLDNYCSENFKISLFGTTKSNNTNVKILSPNYSGKLYDYTLYKCRLCEICISHKKNIDKHNCTSNFVQDRSICSKCDLYFPTKFINRHLKQHSTKPDFIKDNINVVIFNENVKKNDNDETKTIKDNKATQVNSITKNKKNDMDKEYNDNGGDKINIIDENIDEENKNNADNDQSYNVTVKHADENNITIHSNKGDTDKKKSVDNEMNKDIDEEPGTLHKCSCGLHFLSKLKATDHLKKCQPKTKRYKQKCSRCHLLFNTSELFRHIVIHHREKTHEKLKIINL